MKSSESVTCFYCSEYAKVFKDYPLNSASNDEKTFTPRCHLHWKFKCSKCEDMTHFNGIAWCSDCKTFTCVHCTEEKMVRKEFLFYDYYYSIPCGTCGKYNSALDFSEYSGTHPFQIGDLQAKEHTVVWMPINKDETDVRGIPLPFKDKDTTNTGGTLINGLSLPDRVLRKIYWENAVSFYGI